MRKLFLQAVTLLVMLSTLGIAAASGLINFSTSRTATPSLPAYLDMVHMSFPVTVTVIPGSSSTVSLYYSTTPNAGTSPSSANWEIVGAVSAVAATNTVTLPSPVTALKATVPSGTSNALLEVTWSN